jgi:hypothetical protein
MKKGTVPGARKVHEEPMAKRSKQRESIEIRGGKGGGSMALNIGNVIQKAKSELSTLTGLEPSSVLKTAKDEKGWHVSVELVEKRAIPDGMDILATYEVLMDEEGNIIEFGRKGMRKRMETMVE